jgi:hypothetical protein
VLEIGPEPQALSEDDLLSERFRKPIERAIREEIDGDIDAERVTQLREVQRNWLYWEGKQYVIYSFNDADGSLTVGPLVDEEGREKFTCVYNVYLSDGLLFTGATATRSPNCRAVPNDEDNPKHVLAAEFANAELLDLSRAWDADSKQKILAQNAWNSAPTFIYTPYVADAHKYGTTEEPKIEIAPADAGAGETLPIPQVVDTVAYSNGDVECHLLDCRYVSIPFHSKSIADCWYLSYEYLEHKAVLKDLYDLDDRLADEAASAAKVAQSEAQQRTFTPSARDMERWKESHWRHSRYWLRPSHYALIKVDQDETPELRDAKGKLVPFHKQLQEQFPDGLKITLVNGRVVKFEHERMDDVWSVCKPGTGDRILSKPWGNSTIPIQDDLNDYMNMAKENVLRHNVMVAVPSNFFDFDFLRENNNRVHQIVPYNPQTGMDVNKLIAPIPTASMPNDLVGLMTLATQTYRRDIGGVTEALAGGGTPASTYRAEKQRRDQAMMRFAPFFDETQRAWEAAYHNGIQQRAKYGAARVRVPGENGQGAIDVDRAALLEGGWHIEAEEGLPMSQADQADALRWALSSDAQPVVAKQLLGVFEPQARDTVMRLVGIRGMHPTVENDLKKVTGIIQKLLASPPQTDVDPINGQVMQTRPTIEPELWVEDHQLYADLVRSWMNSPKGVRAGKENPDGYANVRAYFDAQRDAVARTAPPPVDANGKPLPPGGDMPPGEQAPPPPDGGAPMPPEQIPQGQEQSFNTAPPSFN